MAETNLVFQLLFLELDVLHETGKICQIRACLNLVVQIVLQPDIPFSKLDIGFGIKEDSKGAALPAY